MSETGLTQSQIDALREISNIGAGSAVTALAQFIGKPIKMEPTAEVILNKMQDLRLLLGGLPLVSVVSVDMPDKISGHLLIIFEQENSLAIAKLLLGDDSGTVDISNELAVSAIKEIGNIMFSAYSVAMGSMASLSIMITPPSFGSGSSNTVFDELPVSKAIQEEQAAICFESSFWIEAPEYIPGYIIFVPSPISLRLLLESIGAKE